MENTVLFSGFNSEQLGRSVAQKLGVVFGKLETAQFADGEIRVRILENVKDKDVVVVQSMYPKTNTAIMQFCFITDALADLGVKRIIGVVPYLGYARQDKAHRPGEAISSQFVARMLEVAGINRFVTCEVHSLKVLDYFGIPAENVSALSLIVDFITKQYLSGKKQDAILISPDQDGAKRVKHVADFLKIPHGFVQKERDLESTDKLKETHGQDVEGDVFGKNVILLDDMIATGSTLVVAAEKLKKRGAKRIFASSTHGIFAKDPQEVFTNSVIEKIVVTDTIEQKSNFEKLAIVSITDLLSSMLSRILKA